MQTFGWGWKKAKKTKSSQKQSNGFQHVIPKFMIKQWNDERIRLLSFIFLIVVIEFKSVRLFFFCIYLLYFFFVLLFSSFWVSFHFQPHLIFWMNKLKCLSFCSDWVVNVLTSPTIAKRKDCFHCFIQLIFEMLVILYWQ